MNNKEWFNEACRNGGIPLQRQRDFEPVSQEAMKEKMKADAITLRLTYAKWSEEEQKALEAQRQECLDKYHKLLNKQKNRP
ncbi:hypothetical protein [Acinetobacter haemolyticus]|uniref:hypothetical protein n=1 Tax=Acinetobacter haemolyticus TaxID=29430 RepID=UPI000D695848|nr:hypothetical protein [Acinetobacter haemolyticus]